MKKIEWKINCASPPGKVFALLTTDEGRKSFWAESAEEIDGCIRFIFPNGQEEASAIIEQIPDQKFSLVYFGSDVTFELSETGDGGTDVLLINDNVSPDEFDEVNAGWVSVLLALKAACDFGIDLRNHDRSRTWDEKFADN